MSEENKRVVYRIVEDHWNKKNRLVADELFAANCSLHTPDGELPGMKGVMQLYDAYVAAFPDFRLTIDDTVAEGDRVAVRYSFAGTHKGPLGGTAASGNRVAIHGIVIFRLAGGKVTEGRFSWDKLGLLQQIGALPRASAQAAS
jgi:predicted ester cyclase